jgi:hypothetical protein
MEVTASFYMLAITYRVTQCHNYTIRICMLYSTHVRDVCLCTQNSAVDLSGL